MKRGKLKQILLPTILAFFISSIYIVFDPGQITSDASEYDRLADSVLVGQYNLDGTPSMLREPGYPFFRALLKFFEFSLTEIMWIQAIMYATTVFLVGISVCKIDEQNGSWGAWGAALSYGLAFYPSQHLSENLTAFALALVGFLFIQITQNQTTKKWFLFGLSSGLLLFTRYAFLAFPVVCIASLSTILLKQTQDKKTLIKNITIFTTATALVITPWMIRNYRQFGVFNVAGRMGAIVYPRAWKAEKSWRALADSYISVFTGRGLLFNFYPTNQSIFQEQWGDWWRDPEKIKEWGKTEVEIDQNRKKKAIEIITSDFNTFSKYVAWTGVDVLRFLALPNPVFPAKGSPIEGTYGPLAKEFGLSKLQILGLTFVHVAQLLWFVLMVFSMIIGFKKYGLRFIPGLILVSIVLTHSIGDGTARHSIPIQPWVLAGIFMTIAPLIQRYIINLNNRKLLR